MILEWYMHSYELLYNALLKITKTYIGKCRGSMLQSKPSFGVKACISSNRPVK